MGGTSNFNESAGGGVRFNGDGSIYKPSAPAQEAPRNASGKKITSVKIPDAYYNQMMAQRRPQAGMAQAKPSVPNTVSGSGMVSITNSRGEQPSVNYSGGGEGGAGSPDFSWNPDKSYNYMQAAVDAGLMKAPPTRAEAIRQQEAPVGQVLAPAAPAPAPAPAPRVEQFAVGPQQAPVKAITNRGGNARAGALRSAAADSSRSRIAAQNQEGQNSSNSASKAMTYKPSGNYQPPPSGQYQGGGNDMSVGGNPKFNAGAGNGMTFNQSGQYQGGGGMVTGVPEPWNNSNQAGGGGKQPAAMRQQQAAAMGQQQAQGQGGVDRSKSLGAPASKYSGTFGQGA